MNEMDSEDLPAQGTPAEVWAQQYLGVDGHPTAQHARRRFLQKLEASEFCPPDPLYKALAVLDPTMPFSERLREQAEKEFATNRGTKERALIEDFASCYWTLPPDQRRLEWERLRKKSRGFPSLIARLNTLRDGLNIQVDLPSLKTTGDEPLETLMKWLVAQYPLRPQARAAARRGMLLELDRASLRKAARAMWNQFPEIAILDKKLLRLLDGSKKRRLKNRDWNQERFEIRRRRSRHRNKRSNWIVKYLMAAAVILVSVACCLVYSMKTDPKRMPSYQLPPSFLTSDGDLKVLRRDDPVIRLDHEGYKRWRAAGGKLKDEIHPPPKIPFKE